MEMRLRNGGLGGVPSFPEWEKSVRSVDSVKELVCIITSPSQFLTLKTSIAWKKSNNVNQNLCAMIKYVYRSSYMAC